MATVTSSAYDSSINLSIEGVEILILAPPGYGKRSFLLRNRHREPFCDFHLAQDTIDSAPNHYYGVICDLPSLVAKSSLSFIFLPPKDVFLHACSYHGIQCAEEYYNQFLHASRVATYVITSGDTLLFYQRFIEKAINHYFEGEPVVPLPTLAPTYTPDPAYPTYSTMVPHSSECTFDADEDMSLCSVVSQGSNFSEESLSFSATSGPDARQGPQPAHAASSLLAACKDYESPTAGNQDLEDMDTTPSSLHSRISASFVRTFNIYTVPVFVGIPTERGPVRVQYFGGNFIRMGSIYMSLLVLCKKRFDIGTVQFSPPNWLVP